MLLNALDTIAARPAKTGRTIQVYLMSGQLSDKILRCNELHRTKIGCPNFSSHVL
jgi:hypothetical protein